MLSIVTVNWNSNDFLYLLIESLERFSSIEYELIVVDNSIEKKEIKGPNIIWLPQKENIGHGHGLNVGVRSIRKNPYLMFLDIDVHFLKHGWEMNFIQRLCACDVIGAPGVPEKPIRPACMFMKRGIGIKYDWRPTEGYKGHRVTPDGHDVAISAYHQIIKDGFKIEFMKSYENRYGTLTGEEWGFDEPIVYHHWHGSHTKERQIDFQNDLEKEKSKLFSLIPWRLP